MGTLGRVRRVAVLAAVVVRRDRGGVVARSASAVRASASSAVARGLERPSSRRRRRASRSRLLRRRAARTDPRRRERHGSARRRSSTSAHRSQLRRRAGAPRPRVLAAYARNGTFYVNYSLRGDGAHVIARYRARNGRVVPAARGRSFASTQPYANHNGGNLAFGPDGQLWVGLGDGGSGGDPENRAQNMDTLLGKMFRLDVSQAQPRRSIVATRAPQPVALQLRPGDRGPLDRRRRPERDRGGRPARTARHGPRQLRLGRLRGACAVRGQGPRPRPPGPARRAVHAVGGLLGHRRLRLPRAGDPADLRGRYCLGDYCSGHDLVACRAAGGADAPRAAFSSPGLSSFGEGLRGELYARRPTRVALCFRFARPAGAQLSRRGGGPAGSARAPRRRPR